MGIFDDIIGNVSNAGSAVGNFLSGVFSKENINETLARPDFQAIETAAIGAGIVGGAIVAPEVVIPILTSVGGFTVEHPLIVGGGLFGLDVISHSSKTQQAIINAPAQVQKGAEDVGNFIDDPSVYAAGQFIKEHPILSAGGALALIGGSALGFNSAITAINSFTTRQNTNAMKNSIGASAPPPVDVEAETKLINAQSKSDIKLAKQNADAAAAAAKAQAKAQNDAFEQQLKLLKAQSSLVAPSTPMQNSMGATKSTKKKTKKKKKKYKSKKKPSKKK